MQWVQATYVQPPTRPEYFPITVTEIVVNSRRHLKASYRREVVQALQLLAFMLGTIPRNAHSCSYGQSTPIEALDAIGVLVVLPSTQVSDRGWRERE